MLDLDDYGTMEDLHEGVCKACGEINGGCEPDAEDYPCEFCGKNAVVGAMNALMDGMFE
jgi:hypothetical protein